MEKLKVLGSKSFFKYTWETSFPVKYKEFGKELIKEDTNLIKLSLVKNIKKESDDLFRVQLRISNEFILQDSKKDYFNAGIKQGDKERYQKIPKGLLLDLYINETSEQAQFNIQKNRWGSKTSIRRLFNLVPQTETPNKIDFSEYFRGYETIPKFKEGKTKEEFMKYLSSKNVFISEEVISVYEKIFKKEGESLFYKYQEEGISEIAKELKIKTAVIRDNDGNYQQNCIDNYDEFVKFILAGIVHEYVLLAINPAITALLKIEPTPTAYHAFVVAITSGEQLPNKSMAD